jgi:hypothetical protein
VLKEADDFLPAIDGRLDPQFGELFACGAAVSTSRSQAVLTPRASVAA